MPHKRARFCPVCGAPLELAPVEGRLRPRCDLCGFVYFFNPAGAAACVVQDARGEVLLVRRAIPPNKGCWALPAGYQEIDEAPQLAALREVREETGIEAEVLRLLDVVWVGDDPRKPANVIVYLCRAVGGHLRPGSDALEAAWFAPDRLPVGLAFGNRELILAHCRQQ